MMKNLKSTEAEEVSENINTKETEEQELLETTERGNVVETRGNTRSNDIVKTTWLL